jgi:hypothetical protein
MVKSIATLMVIAIIFFMSIQVVEAAKITNDGVTIFYEGKVRKGDAERVRIMLEETFIQNINLDSQGGHAIEGFSLGRLFKEYNLVAVVDDDKRCLSACANAILGSPIKLIYGTLGFHVAWSSGKGNLSDGMKQGQQFAVMYTLYNFEMGYGLHFQYLTAMYTDADTMLLLSDEDLELFKSTNGDTFFRAVDLPKGWIASRIAGPARLYLLGEGL